MKTIAPLATQGVTVQTATVEIQTIRVDPSQDIARYKAALV